MAWVTDQQVIKADANLGLAMDVWNALGEAIDALKDDVQYLPEDVANRKAQTIERLLGTLETGKKTLVLGEPYRMASKEEGNV